MPKITQQAYYAVTASDSSTCYPGPTGSLHLSQCGLQTHIVKCKFPAREALTAAFHATPLSLWILQCPRCELDVLLPLQQEQACERSSLLISAPSWFPPTQG